MTTNFNPVGKLKYLALCLAALFCVGLAAQDIKVAVLEPNGAKDVRSYLALTRNAFIETISKASGFQVIDRARTDQILVEHRMQRTSGLISDSEARELGKMLGVDIIFSSEVTGHVESLEINCQAIDIVTGRIVASKSEIVEELAPKQLRETCQELMADMLKTVNRNLSSGLNRGQAGASGGGGSSSPALSGLGAEIGRLMMNNKSNAKWNRNKANYSLEVDLSGVSIAENRQFGTPTSVVSGTISIMLTDAASGDTVGTDLEIEKFTEMGADRIRAKIKAQLQPKVNEIIRELLSSLE